MGPRICGNKGHLTQKIALWDQIKQSYNQGGLKIEGCKIEGLLYLYYMTWHYQKDLD